MPRISNFIVLGDRFILLKFYVYVASIKEKRKARFLSYQALVCGTGIPVNEAGIDEVKSQKTRSGHLVSMLILATAIFVYLFLHDPATDYL